MSETSVQPLVWYVDDEAANRVVFSRSFGRRFRIELSSSGEEALSKLPNESPAVVVTDQRMPGISGTELLAELRERSPDTVRVILTAFADPGSMLDAINRADAARYIVKPWAPSEMGAVLEGAIESFQLQRALRELQLKLFEAQRFGSLGLVAASIAHDMASPLSALLSNMERLQDHRAAVSGLLERAQGVGLRLAAPEREAIEELADIARESHASASYLATLVEGIRGQARAGRETTADPARVLAYVVPLVRGAVLERGGHLEVVRQDTEPVKVASAELCQILVNLVNNAAQALRRDLPERRVVLRVAQEADQVCFAVEDTGVGMSAEQQARAGRERFTTKPEGEGTGLGLTIVRELVERSGGRLELHSAVGEGTTIRFWLPRCAG